MVPERPGANIKEKVLGVRARSRWPCDAKSYQLSVTVLIILRTVSSVFSHSLPHLLFSALLSDPGDVF